ncbi:hypothetical protein ACUUL3_07505 [Thiovibrio sp. JS02]
MVFAVTHNCSHCAQPLAIKETDRLVACGSCRGNNLLPSRNTARYVIPHARKGAHQLFVPYAHLRGTLFSCGKAGVTQAAFEVIRLAAPLDFLPSTIELPQQTVLRFARAEKGVVFLNNTVSLNRILAEALKLTAPPGVRLFHQAYVGDTTSLIYYPLSLFGDHVFDGVSGEALADLPGGAAEIFSALAIKDFSWKPLVLPGACGRCGTKFEGARESEVLLCGKCQSALLVAEEALKKVPWATIPSQENDLVYLPFWKIAASAAGGAINTYGEFAEATAQPREVRASNEEMAMQYWIPAFRIKPRAFLELASRFTVSQPGVGESKHLPVQETRPVTVSLNEALQSLKITFANAAVNQENIFPWLPRLRFQVKSYQLVFVPFARAGSGLRHAQNGVVVRQEDFH